MLGDAARRARLRARADAIAGERPPTAMRWNCGVYDTGIAMLEGRFDDAAALARDTLMLGRRAEHPYAGAVHARPPHDAGARARRRGARCCASSSRRSARAEGPAHWVQAMVARARLAAGREADARALFESLARVDFADVPRNLRWTATLVELAVLCAELGDALRAPLLRELLAPIEHQHACCPWRSATADRRAGRWRASPRRSARPTTRIALYAEALDAARAVGARPMQARIALHFGRFVAAREPRRAKLLLEEGAGSPPSSAWPASSATRTRARADRRGRRAARPRSRSDPRARARTPTGGPACMRRGEGNTAASRAASSRSSREGGSSK